MKYKDNRPRANKKPRTKCGTGVQIVLQQAIKQPVNFKDISVSFKVHPDTATKWISTALAAGLVRISAWNKPRRGGKQYPSVVPQDGVTPPEKQPPSARQLQMRRYMYERKIRG